MADSIFEAKDARSYLGARLELLGRGAKSQLARFLPVHNAYVTQMLAGEAQLSLEQADRCNLFLGHDDHESRFFLLLVSRDRAGTPRLREHYEREIQALREARTELSQRLKFEKSLSLEEQLRYYESWLPAAIHMALTVPALRSVEALSERFHLPPERIHRAIQTLLSLGLAKAEQGRYLPLTKTLHAGRGSPTLKQHHANWRLKCIDTMDHEVSEELHYTSVISLSRRDVHRIRERLIQAIEEVREVVRPSAEEDVFCYTLDLFRVE